MILVHRGGASSGQGRVFMVCCFDRKGLIHIAQGEKTVLVTSTFPIPFPTTKLPLDP